MRTLSLALAGLLAIGASACGGVGEGDDPLGGAQQAQIDPGNRDYVIYTLTDGNGSQLGQVLVTATAGGGYVANREYWYMTSNLSNNAAVTFAGGASEPWSTPPSGLGTLSFTTLRTPTWIHERIRGTMLVYSNPLTGEYDAMDWQMSDSSGAWTGSITWAHGSTGNLFGAGVSRTLDPTSVNGIEYVYVSDPL